MHFAHTKLDGIDAQHLLAAVEPIFAAHGVEPVEILWRTDNSGRVLTVTVERPGSKLPGEGITVDLCAEISRDLSAVLDVSDLIAQSYRLEVSSPGLERALYTQADYARFDGWLAKLKLREPLTGQRSLRGRLRGIDDQGRIRLEVNQSELTIEPQNVMSGRLVFDWNNPGVRRRANGATAPADSIARDPRGRGLQRSR